MRHHIYNKITPIGTHKLLHKICKNSTMIIADKLLQSINNTSMTTKVVCEW